MSRGTVIALGVGGVLVYLAKRAAAASDDGFHNGIRTVPADQTRSGLDFFFGGNGSLPPASAAAASPSLDDLISGLFTDGSNYGCFADVPGKTASDGTPCQVVDSATLRAFQSGGGPPSDVFRVVP